MLSLAIGREGQNARLAAKLTGWRIDIRSDVCVAEAAKVADEAVVQAVGRSARQSRRDRSAAAEADGRRRAAEAEARHEEGRRRSRSR